MALLFGGITPVYGQSSPEPGAARFELGSLTLTPSIRLTDVGYDDNVYGRNGEKQGDVAATFSPTLQAWLRHPVVRVSGQTELDFVYFSKIANLRSIDTDSAVRADFGSRFLQPYVAASLTNTRHSRTYEFDEPVKLKQTAARVGANVRFFGKSSIDASLLRGRTDYDPVAVYGNDNLARSLNRGLRGEALTLRYAVTPLTTVGVGVEWLRDRFDFTPTRDSNRVHIAPLVEFRPDAVISGRAEIGMQTRTFLHRNVPDFRGSFALVNLRYILLGKTRFDFQAERHLGYSYHAQEKDYVLAGVKLSVTRRLGGPWEIRGGVGRHTVTYLDNSVYADATTRFSDTTIGYDAGFAYKVGTTQFAVRISHTDKQSPVALARQYQRLQITSSVTYGF